MRFWGGAGGGGKPQGIHSYHHFLLAVWPWANYLTSLGLSILIYRNETMMMILYEMVRAE